MTNTQLLSLDRMLTHLSNVCFTISFLLLATLLLAFLLQYLWNITMTDVFGLKKINYWQAFRLFLIGLIIFGGALK